MQTAVMRLITAFVCQLCLVPLVQAAQPDPASIPAELGKQESIYRSDDKGYTVDRSLADYVSALSPGFNRDLQLLDSTGRWLDIGAGQGQAVMDYLALASDPSGQSVVRDPSRKAQVVAMSIEDRRTPRWHDMSSKLGQQQMRYLADKRLREYSIDEIGKFQVITDVIGGFSYTDDLSTFMVTVLRLLEVKGTFYTVLQDVQSEVGTNKPYYPDATYLTEMTAADGTPLRVCGWLKQITCVEVTCDLKAGWRPPVEAYSIRKTCESTQVPTTITRQYQAGTPPERRFRVAE
jgi:hypothetical protein